MARYAPRTVRAQGRAAIQLDSVYAERGKAGTILVTTILTPQVAVDDLRLRVSNPRWKPRASTAGPAGAADVGLQYVRTISSGVAGTPIVQTFEFPAPGDGNWRVTVNYTSKPRQPPATRIRYLGEDAHVWWVTISGRDVRAVRTIGRLRPDGKLDPTVTPGPRKRPQPAGQS